MVRWTSPLPMPCHAMQETSLQNDAAGACNDNALRIRQTFHYFQKMQFREGPLNEDVITDGGHLFALRIVFGLAHFSALAIKSLPVLWRLSPCQVRTTSALS